MWSINRPDLGMVGEGYIWDVLYDNVVKWRKANGLPIGLDFEQELVNALCEKYGSEYCKSDDPRAPIPIRQLNMSQVFTGTAVAVKYVTAGMPLESREEAERRASICSTCKLNVFFSKGCGGGICGKLLTLVQSVIGAQGTTHDDHLESCLICGCFLKVAVWIPAKLQWDALPEFQKIQYETNAPSNCWKKPQ